MEIKITYREKLRIDLNGPEELTHEVFGVKYITYSEPKNLETFGDLEYHYKVTDKQRFFLKCVEHGIEFEKNHD